MVQLTVGYVAGFIAAGMFIGRLWSPSIITFIVSGLLGETNSAATWTVAGRLFQRSYWPFILQDDSSYNNGVPRRILLLSQLMMLLGGLISIAAIVTPLGLYQVLSPGEKTQASFKYVKDFSSYGLGTPPRRNSTFSRICINELMASADIGNLYPRPCPFSDTVEILTHDVLGHANATYPYSYDLNVPQIITDVYSSGTQDRTTVSNYFDIQWRQYMTATNTDYNNNSIYTVGVFRNMESLLLHNTYEPIEGLIIDTVKGGIGFRNHTFPFGYPNGVTWQEDLLFIEPETVCIDTNLTLDFKIHTEPSTNLFVTDLILTDRGGFTNLNHAVPSFDHSNPQKNPDLYGRAYKAGWMSNAYAALYYNATQPFNGTSGMKPLSTINSFLNKTYSIADANQTSISQYTGLLIDPDFGHYLREIFDPSYADEPRAPSDSGAPTNPFNVTAEMFRAISVECATSGRADPANITNLYIACGMIYGVPTESKWSMPMYSCASAVKATIKTASFTFNGTEETLDNLNITNVQDKTYATESSMPLWGVEDTGNAFQNSGINLIWGLISPDYANHPNVSTVRQKSLYLPGFYFSTLTRQRAVYEDNMPGSEFYAGSMGTTWTVSGSLLGSGIDYSGNTNMAVWARWQNLSLSAETVSLIPNLIFTDNAASAVVGTKGVLGHMNGAAANAVPIVTTPTVQKIKYHWPFAIPAFIAAFVLLVLSIVGIVLAVSGKRIERLRAHLQRVSPGRIFTAFLYPEPDAFMLKSKEWSKRMGAQIIDLSSDGEKPVGAVMPGLDLPAKVDHRVTESEQVDERDAEVENDDVVSRDSREQMRTSMIPRKPVSPNARISQGSIG